jgi:2'-5' RNA ligase
MAHEPFITDPRHLESATTSYYLVLRPSVAVASAYREVQDRIRRFPFADRLSFPEPHLTLMGYGEEEAGAVVDAVSKWAMKTPPLPIRLERTGSFPSVWVVVVQARRDPLLVEAMTRIRETSDILSSSGDHQVPIENWVFHLSLVYGDWIEDSEWDELEKAVLSWDVSPAECVVEQAELLCFDGGPERLIDVFRLMG